MLDLLMLVKNRDNLFEVEDLLSRIFENDDIPVEHELERVHEVERVINRLLELGETDVVNKLRNPKRNKGI